MTRIVAIDLETTGLDPQKDSIIEIGAVLFNERRIEAEWSSLVNPNRLIPAQIATLTGISNDMVRNAPQIDEIIEHLVNFTGDHPILGHNVQFDLSFLRKEKIFKLNEAIDTYELASVLLPTINRYNLKSLGQDLGILLPATHRALDDARVTHAVFIKLWEIARELPHDLIHEIAFLTEKMDWGGAWVFNDLLIGSNTPAMPAGRKSIDYSKFQQQMDRQHATPLSPVESSLSMDAEEMVSYLDYGGAFSRYFKSYEHRPEQLEMARAVSEALSNSRHLLIEAGTGVGKSFAYLIPASIWAYRNQKRVVISTNTINLQEQLIHKDIPDLKEALGLQIHATILKGRSNYLCPRRLEILRQRGPETVEQLRVLAKVLVWLYQGGTGDRGEINLNGPVEREIWNRISAADDTCQTETCIARTSGICPFYMSRLAAQDSHLIVVNHALLLADVATGNRVLPDYDYLIIDEGHHIESATTNALTFRISQGEISRLLNDLGGPSSGLLGYFLSNLKALLQPSQYSLVFNLVNQSTELIFRLEHEFKAFFQDLDDFLAEQRDDSPIQVYGQNLRVTPSICTLPAWSNIEISWDRTGDIFRAALVKIQQLRQSISEIENGNQDLFDLMDQLGGIHQRLEEMLIHLTSFVTNQDSDKIYWLEISPLTRTISISVAPLQIGPLMEKFLWHEKESVILTSATLTTHEGFDYIVNRLSADEADAVALGSPFDYETSSLLFIANDIPEPNQGAEYQKSVERTLIHLARAVGGRMLVLFTSYAQLKKTSQNISSTLMDSDIIVYEQGEGSSPNILLENFKTADKAVLLGTRSFWEGVDIPGEALSVLVIVRLPFDVPNDPIISARAEMYEDPFNEYNLPEAVLRFRQGFGRLIRTQSDRGVVVILDRRVLTKRYGRAFIESLPECTKEIRSMRDLPAIAAKWLNL